MTTKLTLSVDASVVSHAKLYAKRRGVSVSALVETYLSAVSGPTEERKAPPIRRKLQGILKGADVSAYRQHLEQKYK